MSMSVLNIFLLYLKKVMANISDIKLLLTITPDVTLVGVSSVLDGFQRHPFYWHLLKGIDR